MSAPERIPIRRLTLYKHGVGFVQREGTLRGEELRLVFRADEVNDALKSLLVLDRAGANVLGIAYETPADREQRLAGSPIVLSDDQALLDLLQALRGQQVRCMTADGDQELSGRLVGINRAGKRQPLTETRLVLLEEGGAVRALPLAALRAIVPAEEQASQNLRFFLDLERAENPHRGVTVRLSPGEHDLTVSYLLPSPTWRVTYRLVAEEEQPARPGEAGARGGRLLLQGWGLFDNPLEEDLEAVTVSLVAGQPISFIYDLAASHIPARPVVEDTARVAAAPVEFEEAFALSAPAPAAMAVPYSALQEAAGARPAARRPNLRQALQQQAQMPAAATSELGELFEYQVATPVSVKRGQSALVPILHADLPYRRLLLYNEQKLAEHPVAALQFTNQSGLVLERGPVTILEDGDYHGEAVMPFTKDGGEVTLAFSVELGVHVTPRSEERRETAGIRIAGHLLHVQQAVVRRTSYTVENRLKEARLVTIEHPRDSRAELTGTPAPEGQTAEWYRWSVTCPPRAEAILPVAQRRYEWQTQEVLDRPYTQLAEYLRRRWLDRATLEQLRHLLDERAAIARNGETITRLGRERTALYEQEEQLRKNMAALSASGEEAALRRDVVSRLQACEARLGEIAATSAALEAENGRREAAVEAALEQLSVERAAPEAGDRS